MGTKISELAEVTTIGDDDLIAVVASGVTSKIKKSNFVVAVGIPTVATFADLPAAASYTDKIYRVLTTTGTWILGTKKSMGIYQSNGTTWQILPGAISLTDLIDISISSEPADGKALVYDAPNDVWKAQSYIKGQVDPRTDLTPADGATATLDCSLGNAFKITSPDTGAGMDFTIALSNVPTGTVTHAIEVDIVVGTNVPTISLTGKGANVTLPTLTASRNNIWIISTWDNGTTLMVNNGDKF